MNEAILSVLVVERHPLMRAALCAAIAEESGLAVAGEAASGAEALQVADRILPDAILFALGAPGTDDLQAIRLLQARLPSALILALTDQVSPGREAAALDCGARAVLAKAASRNEIIQALHRMGTGGTSPVSA